MNTIWIVEYGYTSIGEAECFSAAFETEATAIAHAQMCAHEMKEEIANDQGARDAELYDVVLRKREEDGGTIVELHHTETDYVNDWWVVREVPFNV